MARTGHWKSPWLPLVNKSYKFTHICNGGGRSVSSYLIWLGLVLTNVFWSGLFWSGVFWSCLVWWSLAGCHAKVRERVVGWLVGRYSY